MDGGERMSYFDGIIPAPCVNCFCIANTFAANQVGPAIGVLLKMTEISSFHLHISSGSCITQEAGYDIFRHPPKNSLTAKAAAINPVRSAISAAGTAYRVFRTPAEPK